MENPTVIYRLEIEQEADGRWLAEVSALPGVMAYGVSPEDAMAKAEVLALRVLAEQLEHGEGATVRFPHFPARRRVTQWPSSKAKRVLAGLICSARVEN